MCRSWGGFHLWELTGRSIPVQWRIQGGGPREFFVYQYPWGFSFPLGRKEEYIWPTISRVGTFRTSRIMCQSWGGFHLSQLTGRSIPIQWRIQGRDPRGAPPLFLDQAESRRAENLFFETAPHPHPYVGVLMTGAPLSESLDPPLQS